MCFGSRLCPTLRPPAAPCGLAIFCRFDVKPSSSLAQLRVSILMFQPKIEGFCYKSRFWGDIIVVCGARCFVPIVLDAEGPIYWGKTHDIVIPARRLLHKSSALLSLHQPEPRTVGASL